MVSLIARACSTSSPFFLIVSSPAGSSFSLLPFQPGYQEIYHSLLLRFRQCSPFGYAIPLVHATPAAASGSVHCLEDRMPMHWGLFSVIHRFGRSKFLTYKVLSMPAHRFHSFVIEVFPFFFRKVKPGTKSRFLKFIQRLVYRLHLTSSFCILRFFSADPVQILT